MCNYSPTNRTLTPEKGPPKEFRYRAHSELATSVVKITRKRNTLVEPRGVPTDWSKWKRKICHLLDYQEEAIEVIDDKLKRPEYMDIHAQESIRKSINIAVICTEDPIAMQNQRSQVLSLMLCTRKLWTSKQPLKLVNH
ncbi:hypothetical protein TNCV_612521 [Trichonephila clavipes]|nr:hypothetical protein TNCV_612521 [Trichonephila clavipes]